jgi:hypothetical protein
LQSSAKVDLKYDMRKATEGEVFGIEKYESKATAKEMCV